VRIGWVSVFSWNRRVNQVDEERSRMKPGDWERVKDLFGAALELEPSERAAFLAQNCGDEQMREQVERLLRNYQEADKFLDDPALSRLAEGRTAEESPGLQAGFAAPATVTSAETEDPMTGRRFGAYKLVRRIGQAWPRSFWPCGLMMNTGRKWPSSWSGGDSIALIC
jgi:hypothetical protein